MRRFVLLLIFLLLFPGHVAAGASLEGQIQTATGIVRPVDVTLQARAAVRAIEIQTDFRHCCLNGPEAEVIAWNRQSDPVGYLVTQWLNSPAHRAILVDPYWHTIGCAVALGTGVNLGRTYGVCLFRGDPAYDTPDAPVTIPNTAMRRP